MTKHEFRQYRDLYDELGQMGEDIASLRGKVEAPKVANVTHSPKGKSVTTADLVAELIDLEKSYGDKCRQVLRLHKRIVSVIGNLDGRERVIMRARYIRGHSWEKIAADMHYDKSWVHRLHGRILEKVRND